MRRFTLENVGDLAWEACRIAAGAYLAKRIVNSMIRKPVVKHYGYDDVIRVIMNSSMFSEDKSKAIAMIKRSECESYYLAIIYVMLDDRTFSSYKLEMIKQISEI